MITLFSKEKFLLSLNSLENQKSRTIDSIRYQIENFQSLIHILFSLYVQNNCFLKLEYLTRFGLEKYFEINTDFSCFPELFDIFNKYPIMKDLNTLNCQKKAQSILDYYGFSNDNVTFIDVTRFTNDLIYLQDNFYSLLKFYNNSYSSLISPILISYLHRFFAEDFINTLKDALTNYNSIMSFLYTPIELSKIVQSLDKNLHTIY